MKLYYKLLLSVLFACLSLGACKGNGPRQVESREFSFQDDALHYVLYVDPGVDCRACYMKGLDMLQRIAAQQEKVELNVVAVTSEHMGDVVHSIEEKYQDVNITFIERPLPVLHPSVLVMKKKHILFFLYLPVDHMLMKDLLDSMEAVTQNYKF